MIDEGAVAEIRAYLQDYGAANFKGDPLRRDLLDRMIHEASTNQANDQSRTLFGFLTNKRLSIPDGILPDSSEREPSLQKMKAVATPTRFGDVVFLPEDAEFIVIGDTHGDLASTQQIICNIRESGAIAKGVFVVFLGDYVHNGVKSWRNLTEILTFQQGHPESVILLSGNHEFKESYATALNEYFTVHWNHFTAADLPARLQDRLPEHDNHYGPMALDLIRNFGFAEGERIYNACAEWGTRLPYICISGSRMLSHSLGKIGGQPLTMTDLLHGKQQDAESLTRLGYEAWNRRRASIHAAMVNNRDITTDLLSEFSALLSVNQFVVGHCHYRSGDTRQLGDNAITTVVSSSPYSPDSGHYMYQQMVVTREQMRAEENLPEGAARACYLTFGRGGNGMVRSPVTAAD